MPAVEHASLHRRRPPLASRAAASRAKQLSDLVRPEAGPRACAPGPHDSSGCGAVAAAPTIARGDAQEATPAQATSASSRRAGRRGARRRPSHHLSSINARRAAGASVRPEALRSSATAGAPFPFARARRQSPFPAWLPIASRPAPIIHHVLSGLPSPSTSGGPRLRALPYSQRHAWPREPPGCQRAAMRRDRDTMK